MFKKMLRPPGAPEEARFVSKCIRCGKCVMICPYGSIRMATIMDGLRYMGTPVINARKSPCWLCMKCPPVCPSGALDRSTTQKTDVRMGKAVLDRKKCMAWNDTLCRSCYQSCPIFDEAIALDVDLRPVVNEKKCVGCGICENVCPLDEAAIEVKPK